MTLLHAFHFDAGVAPPDLVTNGTFDTAVKRTGSRSVKLYGVSEFGVYAYCPLATPISEVYIQFGFYYGPGGLSYPQFFRWADSAGNVLGGLRLNPSTLKIEVYTGNFATLVATGTAVLAANTWYVIEAHIVIGDAGSITVRSDLTEDSVFIGDTKPGAGTAISYVTWGCCYSAAFYFDDIVIHDTNGDVNNSWPDGAKVYYMVPTGDGATKDWTPSTGTSHYALVDEVPPSATDNLQATGNDKVDILTFPDLPGDAQSVRAVIPQVYAFKGSSTSPTRLALGIDIAGEGVEYSADKDLGLAQGQVQNLLEERPGGGAFSVADISGLSLYLKSAA
jgi:hypothetical protein